MSKRSSWLTLAIIVVILIGSGLVTVLAPQFMQTVNETAGQLTPSGDGPSVPTTLEPETVTIDILGMFYTVGQDMLSVLSPSGELQGQEVSGLSVVLLLALVIGALILVISVPLGLVVILGSRSTTNLQEDPSYQEAVRNIENEQKAFVKERLQTQPPKEKPSGLMPRWSAISTTLVLVALSYFGGVVFGSAISGGEPGNWGMIFALIGLVICLLTVRPQRMLQVDDSMNERPAWSALWVMFSGALVVGLGLGAMYAVITGSNPFEFLSWEWFETNILALLA